MFFSCYGELAENFFFQARKKLVKILQSAVTERRVRMAKNAPRAKKDMMDALIEVEDDSGKRLTDEEIIDVLIDLTSSVNI